MHGLVNQALRAMLEEQHGADVWHAIADRARAEDREFLSFASYPDDLTYRLVDAASVILETPAVSLLEKFGVYWIEYVSRNQYDRLLRAYGETLPEMLVNLNDMHQRIAQSLPELVLPTFQCIQIGPHDLVLHYFSERAGLAPFLVGLLKGLAAYYGVDVKIDHIDSSTEKGMHETFGIQLLSGAGVAA